jgi:Holliday junction resolvase-like predicted endonuclease
VFIARNYEASHAKGELDLVGFDGETLAFVEVRTRELTSGKAQGVDSDGALLSSRAAYWRVPNAFRCGGH